MKTALVLIAYGLCAASAQESLQAFADRLKLDFSGIPTTGCDVGTRGPCTVGQLLNPAGAQENIGVKSQLRGVILDVVDRQVPMQRTKLLREGATTTTRLVALATQAVLSIDFTTANIAGIDDLAMLNSLGRAVRRGLDAHTAATPSPTKSGDFCTDIRAERGVVNRFRCSNYRSRRECDCGGANFGCSFSSRSASCDRVFFPHTSNGRQVAELSYFEQFVEHDGLLAIPAVLAVAALILAVRRLLSKESSYSAVPSDELII